MQIARPDRSPSLALVCLLSLAAGPAPAHATARPAQEAPPSLRVRFVHPDQAQVRLDQMSFTRLEEWLRQGQAEGELLLPLPLAGPAPFPEVVGEGCTLTIDAPKRCFVLSSGARVRGVDVSVFFAGTFPRAVGAGHYAFGLRSADMRLAELVPALQGTALASAGFDEAGLVVSDAPHVLPAFEGIGAVLGAAPAGSSGIPLRGGVELFAGLPAGAFPAATRALSAVGLEGAHLRLAGRLGGDAALLFGQVDPTALDLELEAALEGASLDGLRARLPQWVQPTSVTPSLSVRSAGVDLTIGLAFDVQVELRGERRPFRMSAEYRADDAGADLTLRGETSGSWKRPFGIDWLELESASLVVSGNGVGARADLAATMAVGEQEARFGVNLADDGSARLEARLDSLSVGDLAAFLAQRTGSPFLSELRLGDAARLTEVSLVVTRAERTSLEVSGTVGLGGASADLVLSVTKGGGSVEPLLVLRRHAGSLGDLVAGLKGTPADLAFPESVWTLTPPKGALRKLRAADLGPTARALFEGVYGAADFELELEPGIRLAAALPMSALPQALRQALGITDASASLVLEGALAMTLDLGAGKPSASVQSLELHAELPRVASATARLPEGLPAWMRLDASSERALTVRYEAPNRISFLRTNDVLADLDGATRHFRLSTAIEADSQQGAVAVSGGLVGEWRAPFGLRALTLRDVRLSAGGRAQAGQGGQRSGNVLLEGGFDLGPKSGTMRLELSGQSGRGVSGSFSGSLDSLSLADLASLDLFPSLPRAGLDSLAAVLGRLPALQEPTVRFALDGGAPAVSLAAHVDLRGVRTNLLVFATKGARGPQAVLGIHPENFSLAALFPELGRNPAVAPIANLSLDRFGLLLVAGDQKLVAAEQDELVRGFFEGMTGERDFELDLVGGLNLEARLAASKLPPDLGQALERLNQTMGLESSNTLSLRGTLGRSLSDMSLAIALPPIRPAKAPAWLKSGQLAIAVKGTPSVMLQAIVTLDCEGDLLDLTVEGGVERQGANVAIALKSSLQADDVWKSPFGQEWLEIRRFSGELSIDALANIGFGGGGDVTIGSKDIQVYAWTKINSATGIPMGLVLHGKSVAGVALRDLAVMQGNMRRAARMGGPPLLPLNALPDIALRDLELLIATRAVPDQGIDSPGFKLTGDLYVPLRPGAPGTKMVSVHCEVSKEGIVAQGELGAFQVGPLRWEDSTLDLEATLAAQHLNVHGGLEFLGSRSMVDLQLSREGLAFETVRSIAGLGSAELRVASKFDLHAPTFEVRGKLDNEFGETFGRSVLGEAADVGGKAAAVGAAALAAVNTARQGLEALRTELGIPTPLETLEAVATQQRDNALAARDQQTKGSFLWNQWNDAYERRKERLVRITAGKRAFEAAQAESQRVQAELGNLLTRVANYPGKTIVIQSASFDAALAGLQGGLPIELQLDLLFLGQPRRLGLTWQVGDPVGNARRVVQAVMAGPYNLVHGG